LLLLEWETAHDGRAGNHYVCGRPPFAINEYRGWLGRIANLAPQFDHAGVAR
jgi:hypothetical protein